MIGQVKLMPDQASVLAGQVDALFWFITTICVVFTVLIAGLVIYFAVKFHRRRDDEIPRPILGSHRLEIAWIGPPVILGLVIFGWGAHLYFVQARAPDDALEIYVVGKQWMWKAQHPDGQREINELHVPLGQPVKLTMISEDVIHSFFVPAFRMKQDVLPGRYSTTWFEATQTGRHRLYCAEYCGTEHARMIGWVVVMEPADYETWLRERAEGSSALEGAKLFRKLKCISCHGRGGENIAPLLENIYGQGIRLSDGQNIPANRDYLRESILNPAAKLVAGYQNIMPTYRGQVTEEELLQLIAFIRSLGPGDTPPRVEQTDPPIPAPTSQNGEKP